MNEARPEALKIEHFNPKSGLSPIHVAAANGNTETVEILAAELDNSLFKCEFGKSYHDLDLENSSTPFMLAAVNSHVGTAETLLKLQKENMFKELDAATKYKKY